jgi:hypothetical protein
VDTTRLSVISESDTQREPSPIETIRVLPPVTNRSRLTVHPHDASSSIKTLKPISLSTSSFRSYVPSPSSSIFQKVSWLPSKAILVKDQATQKSTWLKTKQASES